MKESMGAKLQCLGINPDTFYNVPLGSGPVIGNLPKATVVLEDCEVVRKLGSISQHLDKLHEFNNSDQMKLLFASLHVNWPEAGLGHLVAFNLEEIPLWPYVKPLEVL